MKSETGRVAILTRTSTENFGTILQAYALQKYMSSLGFETFVIDDSVPRNEYISAFKTDKSMQSIKERIYYSFDHFLEEIRLLYSLKFKHNTAKFKKSRIRYFTPKNTQELNSQFDIFISGSDQIWATSAEPLLFSFFMQDFVSNGKTQISYAVSIGESVFPESKKALVTQLIGKFDYLSVRELSSKQTLQQYTDNNIAITCDPVFLLNKEFWNKIANQKKVKDEYIFCYFLSENPWYYKKVQELTDNLNLPVYYIGKKADKFLPKGFKCVRKPSPNEFLNYIKNSKFILTDSFHATLFSMIFNKSFNVFERFKIKNNTQNDRLLYILDRFKIKDFYIKEHQPLNLEIIDYTIVNNEINCFAAESKLYLYNALFLNNHTITENQ